MGKASYTVGASELCESIPSLLLLPYTSYLGFSAEKSTPKADVPSSRLTPPHNESLLLTFVTVFPVRGGYLLELKFLDQGLALFGSYWAFSRNPALQSFLILEQNTQGRISTCLLGLRRIRDIKLLEYSPAPGYCRSAGTVLLIRLAV